MAKEKVLLLGASGSMGFEAFQQLWDRKDASGNREFDIVILQRPSEKNKKLFKPFEKKAGISSIPGKGIVDKNGFKIVWGDATNYDDIKKAVNGVDWVLCPMAFISPAADRNPKMAKAVNQTAIEYVVKAIGEEPDGNERIKFVHVGSVAETGDRLQTIHWGRIGDPMKPSVFDFYATTKIRGERALLESDIKHWAVLRQTFIMIPDIMSLQDPIMFHQPIDSFMENNTAEDAGMGLVNCLDIPEDSDFWRRCYNMGGGPKCRITFLDLMRITYDMLGIDYRNVMERKWFALRNFHMQYFEDSHILNEYIHNWREDLDTYAKRVWDNMPGYMKIVAKLCKTIKPFARMVEKATYKRLKAMAERPDGTLGWINNKNDMRVSAFYGSYEAFENIPDWDVDMPQMEPEPEWHRLDHGYDEDKEKLELSDLQGAAEFRGGSCLSKEWNGDMYEVVKWKCGFGHEFESKPFTVLKAGIWCPECLAPPWNYDAIAKKNKFFAQVWYPNHDQDEDNFYPEDCYKDIEGI